MRRERGRTRKASNLVKMAVFTPHHHTLCGICELALAPVQEDAVTYNNYCSEKATEFPKLFGCAVATKWPMTIWFQICRAWNILLGARMCGTTATQYASHPGISSHLAISKSYSLIFIGCAQQQQQHIHTNPHTAQTTISFCFSNGIWIILMYSGL